MTIVRELNKLGEKMTGTNPKTTTDEMAVKYITDNYSSGGGGYVLPKASADTLGGVKVGSNLSIDENGVLSASGGGSVTPIVINIDTYINEYYAGGKEAYANELSNADKTKVTQALTALSSDKTYPVFIESESCGVMPVTCFVSGTMMNDYLSFTWNACFVSSEGAMLQAYSIVLTEYEINIASKTFDNLSH